jgi:hypothetical protein
MAEMLVVLVSGRGALTTLAGVPSVQRHAQAGRLVGLEVVVVYAPERRALGAEIRGLLDPTVPCIPADEFAALEGSASDAVIAVAAEWYLSLGAFLAVRDAPRLHAFGRVAERGCISVPLARVTRAEAVRVARQLGGGSAAASLASFVTSDAWIVDLDSHSEQRLSDNVSTAHAEEKLIENLFGPQRVLPVLRLRPTLAPPLAELFGETALGPAGISAIKLAVGLVAAWVLEHGSYTAGVAGALLYFVARLIGASGVVLARASFSDGDVRERLDLAGDTVLHIALLWSLAGGAARGPAGVVLACIATVGVLASTGIAYVFVIKDSWDARRRSADYRAADDAAGEAAVSAEQDDLAPLRAPRAARTSHAPAAGDEFISRFVQRDGIAYALLFAAFTANLDLLLLASAVASHLFYILWLLARPRDMDTTIAMRRAA